MTEAPTSSFDKKSTPFTSPTQSQEQAEADLERRGESFDGLGRRRIIKPEDVGKEKRKLVGYTRATTFIDAIDDKTALSKWRTRLTLEGMAEHNLGEAVKSAQRTRDIGLRRNPESEKEIAKAYRAELDDISDLAFNEAGGHDSADYGTALHTLVEMYHTSEGLDQGLMSRTEEQWPGLLADFEAYIAAWEEFAEETNARIILTEALLVDDKLKVAGRTDIIALAKLPGDVRARRVILDLKTGKIDNGLRLSQQLAMYAGSKLYDPETGERTQLRCRQDVAIVIHAPRGEARAEFHAVKLQPGRAANALCLRVRQARRRVPGIMEQIVAADV